VKEILDKNKKKISDQIIILINEIDRVYKELEVYLAEKEQKEARERLVEEKAKEAAEELEEIDSLKQDLNAINNPKKREEELLEIAPELLGVFIKWLGELIRDIGTFVTKSTEQGYEKYVKFMSNNRERS